MKLILLLLFLNNFIIYSQDFWVRTNFPDTIIVNTVNIDTSTNDIYAGTYKGIYKSIDQGINWIEINDGITGRKIINHFLILDSLNIYASTFDGLFKTTDSGQNWNLIQIGSGNIYCKLLQKSKEGVFFLCTEGGIYRSIDNGSSWQKIFFSGDNIVFTVIVDSNNIYSHQAPALHKSSDYGNTWKFIYEFSVNNWAYLLMSSLLVERDKILFGTSGGIFFTSDGGNTIIHNSSGIGLKSILDFYKDEGDHIFAVSWEDNLFLTMNFSKNWIPYSLGLQNSGPTSISSDKYGYLFLGTWNSGIYKSTKSTAKFLPDRRTISFYSNLNNLYSDSIIVKNNSDSILIVYDVTVTDNNYTVTPLNFSLDSGDSAIVNISYYPIVVNLDTARIIFENNSFIDKEIIELNGYAGIPVLEIPFQTLSFGQVSLDTTKDTLVDFRNLGVDTLFIDSLIIDNSTFSVEYPNNNLILPFDTVSIKISFSPTALLNYKAKLNIFTNNYSSPDSIILRGTGIAPVSIQSENKNELSFHLFQNYPNPFNSITTISFTTPIESKVVLELYNILGQRVAKLLDSELPVGLHKIIYNGSELVSGIYVYKLIVGEFVSLKKFVLLK